MTAEEPVLRGLYRTRYCTKMEQSISFKEWLESLPEELREGLAFQV